MNLIPGLCPGVVDSYNADKRTCRVKIDGITDGSQTFPEAVFSNPIGDKAGTTEIEILPGDLVWLMFEGGDPRFPIIMGYRTPRAGNPSGTRRWHHENIEITADNTLRLTAETIELVSGALTHNGVNIGSTHTHTEQGDGANVSAPH